MRVLFVCTGNICRSPMAEAVARDLAPEVDCASAGTAAVNGRPASAHTVTVMAEAGLDVTGHRSQSLATVVETGAVPDRIYALEAAHVDIISSRHPEVAPVVQLLDPEGHDIADPYGLEIEAYRAARNAIEVAVTRRALEWR